MRPRDCFSTRPPQVDEITLLKAPGEEQGAVLARAMHDTTRIYRPQEYQDRTGPTGSAPSLSHAGTVWRVARLLAGTSVTVSHPHRWDRRSGRRHSADRDPPCEAPGTGPIVREAPLGEHPASRPTGLGDVGRAGVIRQEPLTSSGTTSRTTGRGRAGRSPAAFTTRSGVPEAATPACRGRGFSSGCLRHRVVTPTHSPLIRKASRDGQKMGVWPTAEDPRELSHRAQWFG